MARARAAIPPELRFRIEGAPVPAARPRTDFRRKRVYEHKTNTRYYALVRSQWDLWVPPDYEMFPQHMPLDLLVVCFMERPKDHFGTGRNAGVLKDWAPRWHTVRNGDFDNLAKLVVDALSGRAWYDDAQIAQALVRKPYTNEQHPEPCTYVYAKPL